MDVLKTFPGVCTWGYENLRIFWIPVGVAIIGGALGGLAEFATHFRLEKDDRTDATTDLKEGPKYAGYDGERLDEKSLGLLRRTSAVIGIAGALGTLFVFVATRWWDTEVRTGQSDALFVFTLSVSAGFGARRLLPKLAERLEGRVNEALETANKAKSTAAEAKGTSTEAKTVSDLAKQEAEEALIAARISQAASSGFALLENPNAAATDAFTLIKQLREGLAQRPRDRSATIVLARLLAETQNDFTGAINALTGFIALNDGGVSLANDDVSDVLFNRACYWTHQYNVYSAASSGEMADRARERALVDLRRSFQLIPGNAQAALSDDDLAALRENGEFQALIAEFSH